jgi:hypothetical protein
MPGLCEQLAHALPTGPASGGLVGKSYAWDGGHSGWGPQASYDRSGFVSAVVRAAGSLSSP